MTAPFTVSSPLLPLYILPAFRLLGRTTYDFDPAPLYRINPAATTYPPFIGSDHRSSLIVNGRFTVSYITSRQQRNLKAPVKVY
jgi:hypothetical protein